MAVDAHGARRGKIIQMELFFLPPRLLCQETHACKQQRKKKEERRKKKKKYVIKPPQIRCLRV